MTSNTPCEMWTRRLVNSAAVWVRMLRHEELERLEALYDDLCKLDRDHLLARFAEFRSEPVAGASDNELAMQLTTLLEWSRLTQPAFCTRFLPSGLLDWVPVSKIELDADPRKTIALAEVLDVSKLPLDDRVKWFRRQVNALRPRSSIKRIRIRREAVLEDASTSILTMKETDLWQMFRFEFVGEPSMDSGGVAREFFSLVAEQTWNSSFGLFVSINTTSGLQAYRVNDHSAMANELHLQYFRFVGRLLAKALIDGHVVPAHLTRDYYKHFMGQPVSFDDLRDIDATLCDNLLRVSESNDVEALCLDFTVTEVFAVAPRLTLTARSPTLAGQVWSQGTSRLGGERQPGSSDGRQRRHVRVAHAASLLVRPPPHAARLSHQGF